MGALTNYALGQLGVNVDKSPLHLEDGELTKAQNAVRNSRGVDGGLVQRPGLIKHNTVAGAGSMLGGIGLPLGTTEAQSGDTATLYYGQRSTLSVNEWWTSQLSPGTARVEVSPPISEWENLASVSPTGSQQNTYAYGTGAGCFFRNKLYYSSTVNHTPGTTSPCIRVFNGTEDYELCKVLPATTWGILRMIVDHDNVYVLTHDSGTSDADWVGRVFKLETDTGHLILIGTALATGFFPSALAVHNGLIFVGASKQTMTAEARVYRINPLDETSWTLDDTESADRWVVTDLQSFGGLLYATVAGSGVGITGAVRQRSVAGVWSDVDASLAANSGAYNSLAVYKGFIYAAVSAYNTNSVIRRSSTGSSWATVATADGITLFDQLVVVGNALFSHHLQSVYYTVDGTTWAAMVTLGMDDGVYSGIMGALRQ